MSIRVIWRLWTWNENNEGRRLGGGVAPTCRPVASVWFNLTVNLTLPCCWDYFSFSSRHSEWRETGCAKFFSVSWFAISIDFLRRCSLRLSQPALFCLGTSGSTFLLEIVGNNPSVRRFHLYSAFGWRLILNIYLVWSSRLSSRLSNVTNYFYGYSSKYWNGCSAAT